ncbi:hypothetical protein ACQEVB_33735 [Pseudonocardia sp. CA-107938]|uniref:hypothetical protein n=1 Tax=Pseudonocardia sp. CA-107938 TaxID=3240021 RepID=UPI003D8AEA9A
MTDHPPHFLASAPAGTPPAQRERVADVWCRHGVRWRHETAGYLPERNDSAHPDIPCLDVGAIPAECQPVTAFDPAEHPNAGPVAVDEVRRELGYRPAHGPDPTGI